MSDIDIDKLIEWLGTDGAIAGLEQSKLTALELLEIAVRYRLPVEKKTKKSDIINELVARNCVRIDKAPDELLAMSFEDLRTYFAATRASRTELLALLARFDITPGSDAMKNLVDFAAREVADIGMYERVARGKQSP